MPIRRGMVLQETHVFLLLSYLLQPLLPLTYTAKKIPFMYSFYGNCEVSVPISTFIQYVCEWFVYSQDRSIYFPAGNRQIEMVGIYKSLTETWMRKLVLCPRNSFSGNICFKFSVLCLCSVLQQVFPLPCLSLLYTSFSLCRRYSPPFQGLRVGGETQLKTTTKNHGPLYNIIPSIRPYERLISPPPHPVITCGPPPHLSQSAHSRIWFVCSVCAPHAGIRPLCCTKTRLPQ